MRNNFSYVQIFLSVHICFQAISVGLGLFILMRLIIDENLKGFISVLLHFQGKWMSNSFRNLWSWYWSVSVDQGIAFFLKLTYQITRLSCSCSVYFNLHPWISFSAIFSCSFLFFK